MRGEYLSHPTTRTEGRQYEPRRRLNRRDSQYTECECLHPLEAGTEPRGSGDGSPIHNTEDKAYILLLFLQRDKQRMTRGSMPPYLFRRVYGVMTGLLLIEAGDRMKKQNEAKATINNFILWRTKEMVEIIEKAKATVKANKSANRSAWGRGVTAYALELLEELGEGIEGGYINTDDLETFAQIESHLLNGASGWSSYSWGGCSLIYDYEIAERLCTPSELKRTNNGERKPNHSEEWLDTQARALTQASRRAIRAIKANK